jgi:hypothetical protein
VFRATVVRVAMETLDRQFEIDAGNRAPDNCFATGQGAKQFGMFSKPFLRGFFIFKQNFVV